MTEGKEHFEVEHYTLLNGWINCWTTTDENGNETPTRYDKFEDALNDLDELFDEVEAEIVSGYREPDMRYEDSDYMIVKFVSGVRDNIYPYQYLPPPKGR
jgi:hypothetical protein